MDYIVIDGVKPYDGRYEFDLDGSELTTREWGWIKRLTDYLPMTLAEGFEGGDPEVYAAFAAIAVRRAGKIENGEVADLFDRILDAPFGTTIRLEAGMDGQENDADPPPSSSSSSGSSGDESTNTLAISPDPPNGSGIPASDSSPWPLTRSAT